MSAEELPSYCSHCRQQIYGARCYIQDHRDEEVHYGCLRGWRARKTDEAFQVALQTELRSLKSHLRNQRRQLYKERWQASRIKPKRKHEERSQPLSCVVETTSEGAAPHLAAVPQTGLSSSIWSLATTLCSGAQRLFASFLHCWPTRHFSLQWFTRSVPRVSHTCLQWFVQRMPFLPLPSKGKVEQRFPRRPSRMKQGRTRVSRTMTRGAALSRISASQRGVSLSSWAAVRIKRRDWLVSEEPWHRHACRYVLACFLRNGQTEKRRDIRASQKKKEKKKRRFHQAKAVTQQPLH